MMLHRTTARIAPLVAAGVLFAACGSSSGSSSPSTPETNPVATTVVDDEESSEVADEADASIEPPLDEPDPVDGGECADDDCDDQPNEPVVTVVEQPVVTVIDDPLDDEDSEPFVPAAGDAAFCAAIAEFDDQTQPADDAEAALVIQTQMALLIAVAPDLVQADLAIFDAFINRVVAGDATLDDAATDQVVEAAGDRLSEYIDINCEGRGGSRISSGDAEVTVDPDSPVDPVLPEGIVIPVIEFTSEPRNEPQPLFGERADDGTPADPAPGFTPDSAHAGFCTSLDIIESRPQPTEDFEEVVVAEGYLVAIEALIPDEIVASYSTLMGWISELMANGSFDDMTEPEDGGAVGTALDTIDAFVNERCLGL